jgi:hypothetical protein
MLDSAVRECDESVAPGIASVLPPRRTQPRGAVTALMRDIRVTSVVTGVRRPRSDETH